MAAKPGSQEQMEAQMRKMVQKTYILDFTKSESMFKQKQELDGPKVPKSSGAIIMIGGMAGGRDVLYKNIKEKRMANKTELMGKIFLIKDNLVSYDWELTGETKNIGNYTCYKAVFEKEEESIEIKMIDGEVKEEKGMKKMKGRGVSEKDIQMKVEVKGNLKKEQKIRIEKIKELEENKNKTENEN